MGRFASSARSTPIPTHDIALRTQAILDIIVDAVPDGSAIPAPMLQSIERFTVLLDEVRCSMETISLTGGLSRVVHLNRNERALRDIKARLDDAYRDFSVASALRVEAQQADIAVQQTQLAGQQAQTHLAVGKVVAATHTLAPELSSVLFYSRLSVFLAGPCEKFTSKMDLII
ncbi:hypothetical protein B0H13DRAFT_2268303 [Mycena leptocephala]|nr:hypothetical protein B0H13DRAFT_2268303 [Mycena leptocephala]